MTVAQPWEETNKVVFPPAGRWSGHDAGRDSRSDGGGVPTDRQDSGSMERRAVIFSGRVQGVGFRATTRSVAAGFAVTGWVRNEPDGTVRCEVQGDRTECERFLASLGERMERYIRSFHAEQITTLSGESGFDIRH